MAEPTVQVPVSLIRMIDRDLGENAWHPEDCPGSHTAYCTCAVGQARRSLRALLAQPTPTAEPMRAAQSDGGDRLIEFAEHVLGVPLDPWQMRLCRRVFGGNVGRSTGRPDAAPPSIADMVPGTTFGYPERGTTAAPPRIEDMAPGTTVVIAHTWQVVRRPNGATFLYRDHDGYGQWAAPSDIDPSTIRDVNPPKDATS